jgi:hypothetical protein
LTDGDDEDEAPPTVRDVLTRWRYTLTPTLYVDEHSSTNDILWQQVLEHRAIRGWLVALFITLLVILVTGTTFALIVVAATS